MHNKINKRLELLRSTMIKEKIQAVVFPSGDPHMSEYVAHRFGARYYFSGFSGSSGTLVVTLDKMALWTDGRYTLAATEALQGTSIALMIEGEQPSPPEISSFLLHNLPPKANIAVDTLCVSYQWFTHLQQEMATNGHLLGHLDLYDLVDKQREDYPQQPITLLTQDYTGASCADKINLIRQKLIAKNGTHYLVSALDDVAWLTNLRGSDIHFNPLFYAYLLITATDATLFVSEPSLHVNASLYLKQQGVKTANYHTLADTVNSLHDKQFFATGAFINAFMVLLIQKNNTINYTNNWVQVAKSIKNSKELHCTKEAHIADGVAITRLLHRISLNEFSTEWEIVEAIEQERQRMPSHKCPSFPSIVGSASNGAVVHYRPTEEKHASLTDGLIVIDSGAHYLGATTDITRTVSFGAPTPEQCEDYTLTLKAHIALARQHFSTNTSGAQLDAFARGVLWNHNLDYAHGTGHGVGAMLCVHEGPLRINGKNTTLIAENMIFSIEPGIYKAHKHGVRLENLYYATHGTQNEHGHFLRWQVLTYCPFQRSLINQEMLTEEEKAWLNTYHKEVYTTLSPYIQNEDAHDFLLVATAPL
jgi:Xaa-Pro aminopeptidase